MFTHGMSLGGGCWLFDNLVPWKKFTVTTPAALAELVKADGAVTSPD